MFKFVRFSLLLLAMGISATAFAHGPQMQITNDGGKITTRQIMDDVYSPLSDPTGIFGMPLVLQPDNRWFATAANGATNGPGLAFGLGQTFPAPAAPNQNHFIVNVLDGLKVWNGSTFADPGLEQARLYRGSPAAPTASATTQDSGPFNGFLPFGNLSYGTPAASSHASAQLMLLGDGSSITSVPDDGLYLLSLSVGLRDINGNVVGSVADSDPYYFLLNKNADSSYPAAVSSLQSSFGISNSQVQVVPEPGTWFAVSGLLVGALCIKRRSTTRRVQIGVRS